MAKFLVLFLFIFHTAMCTSQEILMEGENPRYNEFGFGMRATLEKDRSVKRRLFASPELDLVEDVTKTRRGIISGGSNVNKKQSAGEEMQTNKQILKSRRPAFCVYTWKDRTLIGHSRLFWTKCIFM